MVVLPLTTSFVPRLSLFMLWFRQEPQNVPKITTLLQNPQAMLSAGGGEETVHHHGLSPLLLAFIMSTLGFIHSGQS